LRDDERSRYSRFAKERDRSAFAVTRAALRCLLAREIGVSPKDVSLIRNAWGKLLLADNERWPELDFSVSHAGELSVIAVSRCGPVGVDIERRRHVSEMERIATDIFDETTAAALRRLPLQDRDTAFFRLWTAGEACLKAMGLGFAGAGGRAPVGLSSEGLPLIRTSQLPCDMAGDEWALHSLDVPADYAGSLVVRDRARSGHVAAFVQAADMPRLTSLAC
jgi:4'-phosphopantetheinyl transferase